MARATTVLIALAVAIGSARAADAPVTFQEHVLPIFRNACLNCHNPDKKKAGLDLSTYAATLAGSDSASVVTPGDLDASMLYKTVMHEEEPFMPLRADKLPPKDLETIKKWIDGGALEHSGIKAAAKPKVDMKVSVTSIGKPQGPAPMPKDLPREPAVRTSRPGALNGLAHAPWAPLVALGGQKQILLYNADTLQLLGVLPFNEGLPQSIRFSRNGSLLVAGGGQAAKLGKVVVWDVITGKRIAEVGEEYDAVLAADISPDQTRIALGGPGKLLKVLTINNEPLHSIKKHTDWITAVAYSPDGILLASGDRAGSLVVWESRSANEYLALAGHKGAVTGLAFRGDSNVLASASEDGTIKLWNLENGQPIKSWNAHGGGVLSVGFAHDGRLVSAGRDKLVKTWKPDGAAERQFQALPDISLHAVFNHDGSRVIAGDWSGRVRVYSATDGRTLGELPLAIPPVDPAKPAETEKRVAELKTAVEKADAEAASARQAAEKAERANK